ncbi:MAG TPA: hypothetical protein VLT36_01995 [Candidatus Dormibacteraeota bacterium]|nr:hypothetical protein [Candidatus Dormibacteraeota bacterium]
MKKLALLISSIVVSSLLASAEPSETDQKWLKAVQTMVAKGETKVSTASEDRLNLFKEWANSNGYSLKIAKAENSFTIEVSRKTTSDGVAQK